QLWPKDDVAGLHLPSLHCGPPGLNHTGRMFATDIPGPPGLALSENRLPWTGLMPGNGPEGRHLCRM
ncbi:MAG: hypothetical protein KDC66_10710, partial [Phaeodactylibacter sp.]|nr:hypothetical protein [Phaeodactylibacter sp.]